MIRSAFFVLAASCSFALAQSGIQSAPSDQPAASSETKKLPLQLVKPTETPGPQQPKRTPDEIVATFFGALKADRVDAAYDSLKPEFAMAERGDDEAKSMRAQTQKALDTYGPVLDSELVLEEKLGTHLIRRSYLLINDVLPLRWKFYFYKPADRWFLIDLRIDDGIPAWFDEAARPVRKPAK